MFVTEVALLLMYVGAPIVTLIALLWGFRWVRRVQSGLQWYAAELQKAMELLDELRERDLTGMVNAKTVTRIRADLDDLRDNHENLYTQFKKFRSRVTMQQRRAVEEEEQQPKVTNALDQQPGESKEDWKLRVRTQLAASRATKQ